MSTVGLRRCVVGSEDETIEDVKSEWRFPDMVQFMTTSKQALPALSIVGLPRGVTVDERDENFADRYWGSNVGGGACAALSDFIEGQLRNDRGHLADDPKEELA